MTELVVSRVRSGLVGLEVLGASLVGCRVIGFPRRQLIITLGLEA